MTEAETIAVRDCHAAKLHAAALGGSHYDGFSAIILHFALLCCHAAKEVCMGWSEPRCCKYRLYVLAMARIIEAAPGMP